MQLGQQLVQKQTQKLIITQDLRQSIELLQLSGLELAARIEKELLENPLLEERNEPQAEDPEQRELRRVAAETMETGWSDYGRTVVDRENRKQELLENTGQAESLADHLLWQYRMLSVTDAEISLAELIVSALDERGFLIRPLEELLEDPALFERAQRVLSQIQELDPVGCGSSSIQEALLVQARLLHPDQPACAMILEKYFTDLEELNLDRIEKASGLSPEEMQGALDCIKSLSPLPAGQFPGRNSSYILPDLYVIKHAGSHQVIVNDDWMPQVAVSDDLRTLMETGKPPDQEYLQSKLSAAQWLLRSVEQRKQTLLRVMQAIVELQQDFFEQGPGHLHPLTLKSVATELGLHESTISRITTNKYVQTRWGIFELKFFFSSALASKTGSLDRFSSRSIQEKIKDWIATEDPEHPLSDQDLVDRLSEAGVEIARRTVAKYRQVLQILPVDRRKKLNQLRR